MQKNQEYVKLTINHSINQLINKIVHLPYFYPSHLQASSL